MKVKNKIIWLSLIIIPFLWANLLNESFSDKKFPPEGWQIYNLDNGIVCWHRSPAKNYTPPACARSRFEKQNRRNDDWLITPQIFPVPGKDTLKFYYRAHNKNFSESLEIWVSISGNKPENFYTRVDAFGFRNREYALRVVPLNNFDSIPIFIAFRNVGLFGVNSCYIDDVSGVALTPYDVGVIEIVSPRKIENPGPIYPEVVIKNFGQEDANNFSLEITIKNSNNQPVYYTIIDNLYLEANKTLKITASNQWLASVGEYRVIAKTIFSLDKNPYNDQLEKNVLIPANDYHDVGIKEIVYPVGYVPQGWVIPVGIFENCGNCDEEFTGICLIYKDDQLVYGDTLSLSIEKFNSKEIAFEPFNVDEGDYQIIMKAILENDMDLSNNEKTDYFYSDNDFLGGFRDVGLVEILAPTGEYEEGIMVSPQVKIKNYGYHTETFSITFNILKESELVYSQKADVYALGEDEERIISFPPFPIEEGNFLVVTYLSNLYDQNPTNDTLTGNFLGKKPYVPPPGFSGWVLRRDMPILEYNPKKVGSGAALTFIDNYIYATKGNKSFEFYKYHPRFDKWYKETDIPKGEKNKGVKGGALTSGNNRIYLLKGNGTNEFYAYDLETKNWERLKNLPKKVKEGAAIVYLENEKGKFLYITPGGGTCEFFAYDLEKDTFIFLKDIPKGRLGKGAVKGSALCNFQNQYLYFLKGKSNEFYCYNVYTDSWEEKEPLPFFTPGGVKKKTCGPGAALTTDNEKYIYAFKGNNTNEFCFYDIQNNQWEYLEPIPLEPSDKKVKDGGALVYVNGWIYALKGNKTLELWLFIPPAELYGIKRATAKKGVASLKTIAGEKIKKKDIIIYNTLGRRVGKKLSRGIYFFIEDGKKIKKLINY
jgi:hypothetical protein